MKRRRRQRRRPAPERLEDLPPSWLDTELARILAEAETKRASLFAEAFTPLPNLAELMSRSGSDDAGGPKHRPGSAAAWIDELWPNDEWHLMRPKRIHDEIVDAALGRKSEHPSLTAVRDEINRRLGKPKKRGKRGKRGQRAKSTR
jgi:hypothetical protein